MKQWLIIREHNTPITFHITVTNCHLGNEKINIFLSVYNVPIDVVKG
jgi:hypothetical protein